MQIGESLIEGDGAIVDVIDDKGLRHIGDRVMQAALCQAWSARPRLER
jgi:hypothetical protein